MSSTGVRSLKRLRSSSTYCAKRDRLATHRIEVALVLAKVDEHPTVLGVEELEAAATEDRASAAHLDDALHPVRSEPGIRCCDSTLTAW